MLLLNKFNDFRGPLLAVLPGNVRLEIYGDIGSLEMNENIQLPRRVSRDQIRS